MPLARLSIVGCAVPSLSWAHGQTPNGSFPNQSVTAIGTTPTASKSSCSLKPALTTRFGGLGIFVSPKACLTVTDPSDATAPGFFGAHPAATRAAPAVSARKLRREVERTRQSLVVTRWCGRPGRARVSVGFPPASDHSPTSPALARDDSRIDRSLLGGGRHHADTEAGAQGFPPGSRRFAPARLRSARRRRLHAGGVDRSVSGRRPNRLLPVRLQLHERCGVVDRHRSPSRPTE